MANRYWVTGGDGNWNSTTNWSATSGGASGASVPGAADAALLDANSGAGTVTVDISPDIQTLTCTGFTGTLAFGTNTISLNSTGTIFTGATTMTVTGTPQIICTNATATARTISPQVVTEANSISFRVTAGTGTFAITSTHVVRNLDFTDGVNPTGFAGALTGAAFTTYGSLKASTGMTQSASTNAITFAATSGTKTIDTAGVTFDRPFVFNGVGGTFQLASALTSGATRSCTLTNGTLDLVSYTLTTGIFSSSNVNTRTIAFGTGNITLTGNNATILALANAVNLTVTGSRTFNAVYSGSVGTRNMQGVQLANGGTEANAPDINITNGSDIVTMGTNSRIYRNINFTGFSGTLSVAGRRISGNLTLSTGMTLDAGTDITTFMATSGTQSITSNGKTMDFPVTIDAPGATVSCVDALTLGSTRTLTLTNGTLKLKDGVTSTVGVFATSGTDPKFLLSTTFGAQATLSAASGTFTVNYLTVQDNIATGGAIWDALAITNVDAGNNTGWLFSTTPSIGNEITMRLRSFTQPRRF